MDGACVCSVCVFCLTKNNSLEKLSNVRNRRLEALKKVFGGKLYNARQKIDGNAAMFQGEVFGPISIEVVPSVLVRGCAHALYAGRLSKRKASEGSH